MKKVLEVIIDDDGKMKFSSEYNLGLTKDDYKLAIEGLVECLWKDKNEDIYPIIRVLGMAEMMSTAQPYSLVESFWSTMMFSFIPRMEKFATELKSKYGFKDEEVTRPMRWGDQGYFDMLSMEMPISGPIDDQDSPGRPKVATISGKWS